MPLSSAVAAAPLTLGMAIVRLTASAGNVGFCWPKVPPAVATIRVVPSWASLALRSPLALSVRPTAPTMAATPTMGPSMIRSVRVLRAVRPDQATPSRSRRRLTAALRAFALCFPLSDTRSPPLGRGARAARCARSHAHRLELVGHDAAVPHRHLAGRGRGHAEVVGDHDHRPLVRLQ